MNRETRTRVEERVKKRIAKALIAWYMFLFHSLRQKEKEDWKKRKHDFLDELYLIMLWAANEMAQEDAKKYGFEYDAALIYALYEGQAENRLKNIAEVTERHSKLLIDDYLVGLLTWDELIKELQKWYGDKRAERIAIMESGFMESAVTSNTMRQTDKHTWIWRHGNRCKQGFPCAKICAPHVGKTYTMAEQMPPSSSHFGCDCYPEIT